jgi:hypothetical protein
VKNGGLVFSLDNKRYDEQKILIMLDKVYIFKGKFVGKVQTANYKKKRNCMRLDHHPITRTIKIGWHIKRG